jgi:hypothetical protein
LSEPAGAPRITRAGAAFRVAPWDFEAPAGGWADAFAVYAGDNPTAPPMLGAYARDGDGVAFTPRFVPAPAVRLRAVARPPGGEPLIAWFGGVPQPERAPSARVVAITPSADVWPENVLRFYVTFSAPMRIGVAWDNIRMLDASGRAMGGMFVEIEQELWDPEGRRMTVLFDPARIKRGLVDNINEGPPLSIGETCTLEIDHTWRDAAGSLLVKGLRKTIQVAPPLRGALDPAHWRLTPPASAGAPLTVDFPHPLDAALALRAFSVKRGQAEIDCTARLEANETRLTLTPDHGWRAGRYTLVADAVLEDIAGNRIGRPFDVDTRATGRVLAHGAEIPFDV